MRTKLKFIEVKKINENSIELEIDCSGVMFLDKIKIKVYRKDCVA